MLIGLFSFLISSSMVLVILFTSKNQFKMSLDLDLHGVQKYHKTPVPRVGGLAIFISLVFTALLANNLKMIWSFYFSGLIVPALVVFIGGFSEDITKDLKPSVRLLFMVIATVIAIYLTNVLPIIDYSGIGWIDIILSYQLLGILLTVFIIIGITNAYNIIDGYNGLSAVAAIINILGLMYLANVVGDIMVWKVSISLIAALIGFLIFNYPKGKIFLGDGGAYFIGFVIGILSVRLIQNHHNLSSFSVLLLAIYPIMEIGFSIYRRKFLTKSKGMQPDNMHLHQLIFHRMIAQRHNNRNALVLPIMMIFIIPQIIVVMLYYSNKWIMLISLIFYVIYYIYAYFSIVKFKTIQFLRIK